MQYNAIDDKPLYRRGYDRMQETLVAEFGLDNNPIAVKFFYAQIEIDHFKKWHDYIIPESPASFQEFEHLSHTADKIFFLEATSFNCDNTLSHFHWHNDCELKPRHQLQPGLLGIAIAPLKNALYVADTVHFLCPQTQADKILGEWQGVAGVEPLTIKKGNVASCEYCVAVHNENLATTCSCSLKEDTVTNVILPADHLKHLVDAINERKITLGPSSLSRPGDGFFRINLG